MSFEAIPVKIDDARQDQLTAQIDPSCPLARIAQNTAADPKRVVSPSWMIDSSTAFSSMEWLEVCAKNPVT